MTRAMDNPGTENGFPVTRAMLKPRERHGIREFCFTTNTSCEKVSALRSNQKGGIYFVDRRFFRGVSLAGYAEILEDAAGIIPFRNGEPLFKVAKSPNKRLIAQDEADPDDLFLCLVSRPINSMEYSALFPALFA